MNTPYHTPLAAPRHARLLALTLSAVLTLGMLLGIHALAELPDPAAQMAHVTQPRA
ncbi:MAG TPA: hypothetical protein PLA97_03235 [Rubrivivax sp.]|nr:hypothetical protein [Rubrivivax sp.]